jgi:hypothetical protein
MFTHYYQYRKDTTLKSVFVLERYAGGTYPPLHVPLKRSGMVSLRTSEYYWNKDNLARESSVKITVGTDHLTSFLCLDIHGDPRIGFGNLCKKDCEKKCKLDSCRKNDFLIIRQSESELQLEIFVAVNREGCSLEDCQSFALGKYDSEVGSLIAESVLFVPQIPAPRPPRPKRNKLLEQAKATYRRLALENQDNNSPVLH